MANKLNIPECRFVDPKDTVTLTIKNYELIISPDDLFQNSADTFKTCGLRPSELLYQRNDLIDVCRRVLANELNSGTKMHFLIQKLTQ